MAESILHKTRVWDLPTRLFHWLLALAVVGAVASAYIGGNAMTWHFRLGYTVFALLAFRLLWGFVGGYWSRFWNFIYSPTSHIRYLRGERHHGDHFNVGHSPTASFSVFALLAILLAQVATGLVADDEIDNVGPLNRFVSGDVASKATSWHADIGQWVIIGLVVLHIVAVIYYLVAKRIDLVRPMISGDKALPSGTPASADRSPQRVLALILICACAGFVTWIVRLGG